MVEYHLKTPLKKDIIKKLKVGDIVFLSGTVFTARDSAHQKLLKMDEGVLPFSPSEMVLYHCGPLMKKVKDGWKVISAGPTTSSRMELFENDFIENFKIKLIIGKGDMGKDTQKALQKYICVYTSYTGGAGALAADKITEIKDVYYLDELGMAEAIWVFEVKDFGPLVVSMDSDGNTIYKDSTCFD